MGGDAAAAAVAIDADVMSDGVHPGQQTLAGAVCMTHAMDPSQVSWSKSSAGSREAEL